MCYANSFMASANYLREPRLLVALSCNLEPPATGKDVKQDFNSTTAA